MSDLPIREQIERVRQSAERQVRLYSLTATVAVVLAAVLLAVGVDYLVRWQDVGLRVLASLAVLVVAVAAVYRWTLPALRHRVTEVEAAQRVERRFPQLAGRLASAIEFAASPPEETLAGSPALRRAVVLQASSLLENVNVADAIDRRPTRRVLLAASAVVLLLAFAAALNPPAARIGLARLAMPWQSLVWPQRHLLALVEPVRQVGLGDTFEVAVVDLAGELPEKVTFEYRRLSDTVLEPESIPMQPAGDRMVIARENVQEPFEYRAVGGDDDSMEWTRVAVVEPPKIEAITITIRPPAYTGWPSTTSDRRITALRGTQASIDAQVQRPIRAAVLKQAQGDDIAAEVLADGRSFQIGMNEQTPFVVQQSGEYWFELTDESGYVRKSSRWDIVAIEDQAPRPVVLERPAQDVYVTPRGRLPIQVSAKDDIALRDITLHYARSDRSDEGEQSIAVWRGPDAPTAAPSPPTAGVEVRDARVVDHAWDLEPLALPPGTRISLHATASDYRPQQGQSVPRQINVIDESELLERLDRQQSLLLQELMKALALQQSARDGTTAVQAQLVGAETLRAQDVDQLQAAQRGQRDVVRMLTDPEKGIPAQLGSLREQLQTNRLENPSLESQLASVTGELEALSQAALPGAESELNRAIKTAQASLTNETPPAQELLQASLGDAGRHQDAVLESLRRLAGDLGQWDQVRQLSLDLHEVQRGQTELAERTRQLLPQTLGRSPRDLTPQQRTDLAQLSARQGELARAFDRLRTQLREAAERLTDAEPEAAVRVSDALSAAGRQDMGARMQSATQNLEANRLGQALPAQQQAIEDLQELLDILTARGEHEPARLLKKLREAEAELEALRAAQADQRKRSQDAAAQAGAAREAALKRLAGQQEQRAEQAAELSRRLERLRAKSASDRLQDAAQKMSDASDRQNQADDAGASLDEAERQLDEAQRQLAARRKQIEKDLADLQLARIKDTVEGLAGRQEHVVDETQRLEQLHQTNGELTPGQLESLAALAEVQTTLRVEVDRLTETLASAEVVALALRSAGRDMQRAADLLRALRTDAEVVALERRAFERLQQIVAVLDAQSKTAGDEDESGEGERGESAGSEGNNSDGIGNLAQLELLQKMQQKLNERTAAVAAASDQPASVASEAERAAIAVEQGELAQIAARLGRPSQKAAQPETPVAQPVAPAELPIDSPQEDRLPPAAEEEADNE